MCSTHPGCLAGYGGFNANSEVVFICEFNVIISECSTKFAFLRAFYEIKFAQFCVIPSLLSCVIPSQAGKPGDGGLKNRFGICDYYRNTKTCHYNCSCMHKPYNFQL